jgi:hypothetical protein
LTLSSGIYPALLPAPPPLHLYPTSTFRQYPGHWPHLSTYASVFGCVPDTFHYHLSCYVSFVDQHSQHVPLPFILPCFICAASLTLSSVLLCLLLWAASPTFTSAIYPARPPQLYLIPPPSFVIYPVMPELTSCIPVFVSDDVASLCGAAPWVVFPWHVLRMASCSVVLHSYTIAVSSIGLLVLWVRSPIDFFLSPIYSRPL